MNKSKYSHGRAVKNSDGTTHTREKAVSREGNSKFSGALAPSKRNRNTGTTKIPAAKANRASMADPESLKIGNITSVKCQKLVQGRHGSNPLKPLYTTINKLKSVFCESLKDIKTQVNSSQCVSPKDSLLANLLLKPGGNSWTDNDTIDEIEQFISSFSDRKQAESPNIRISDKPRVTVVAEKFTRFRKDDIEVRKLDTKIVCIEYDIFDDKSSSDEPIQKMRAFFTVKPTRGQTEEGSTATIPSEILKRLNVNQDEFKLLSEKEIEVIDGKLPENKPYVDNLRKVLLKKQVIYEKKNRKALDLLSMYRMAKKDSPPLDCDYSTANMLSKAELDDVKELILMRCNSTDNMSRRKVRRKNDDIGIESESVFLELLRDKSNR